MRRSIVLMTPFPEQLPVLVDQSGQGTEIVMLLMAT
jgi:hypothetical protein